MAARRKPPPMPDAVRAYFQAEGRRGGKLGGAKRWVGVPPAERSRLARAAVAAREAKRRRRA